MTSLLKKMFDTNPSSPSELKRREGGEQGGNDDGDDHRRRVEFRPSLDDDDPSHCYDDDYRHRDPGYSFESKETCTDDDDYDDFSGDYSSVYSRESHDDRTLESRSTYGTSEEEEDDDTGSYRSGDTCEAYVQRDRTYDDEEEDDTASHSFVTTEESCSDYDSGDSYSVGEHRRHHHHRRRREDDRDHRPRDGGTPRRDNRSSRHRRRRRGRGDETDEDEGDDRYNAKTRSFWDRVDEEDFSFEEAPTREEDEDEMVDGDESRQRRPRPSLTELARAVSHDNNVGGEADSLCYSADTRSTTSTVVRRRLDQDQMALVLETVSQLSRTVEEEENESKSRSHDDGDDRRYGRPSPRRGLWSPTEENDHADDGEGVDLVLNTAWSATSDTEVDVLQDISIVDERRRESNNERGPKLPSPLSPPRQLRRPYRLTLPEPPRTETEEKKPTSPSSSTERPRRPPLHPSILYNGGTATSPRRLNFADKDVSFAPSVDQQEDGDDGKDVSVPSPPPHQPGLGASMSEASDARDHDDDSDDERYRPSSDALHRRHLADPSHNNDNNNALPRTLTDASILWARSDERVVAAAVAIQARIRGRLGRALLLRATGVSKRRRWEPRHRSARTTLLHSQIRRAARAWLREGRGERRSSMVLAVRRVCAVRIQQGWQRHRLRRARLRAGNVNFEVLSHGSQGTPSPSGRLLIWRHAAREVQRTWRGWCDRRVFVELIAKVILLQCLARRWLYNTRYATQRKATVVLQKWTRVVLVRQRATRAARAAEKEMREAAERERASRRPANAGDEVAAVVRIQSRARTFVYRNRYLYRRKLLLSKGHRLTTMTSRSCSSSPTKSRPESRVVTARTSPRAMSSSVAPDEGRLVPAAFPITTLACAESAFDVACAPFPTSFFDNDPTSNFFRLKNDDHNADHHRYHNGIVSLESSASGDTRVVAAAPAEPPDITYVHPTHPTLSAITTESSMFGSASEAHKQPSTSFFPVGDFAQGGVSSAFSLVDFPSAEFDVGTDDDLWSRYDGGSSLSHEKQAPPPQGQPRRPKAEETRSRSLLTNDTATTSKPKRKNKNKKTTSITTTALATTATTPHSPAPEVRTHKDLLASKWDNLDPTSHYDDEEGVSDDDDAVASRSNSAPVAHNSSMSTSLLSAFRRQKKSLLAPFRSRRRRRRTADESLLPTTTTTTTKASPQKKNEDEEDDDVPIEYQPLQENHDDLDDIVAGLSDVADKPATPTTTMTIASPFRVGSFCGSVSDVDDDYAVPPPPPPPPDVDTTTVVFPIQEDDVSGDEEARRIVRSPLARFRRTPRRRSRSRSRSFDGADGRGGPLLLSSSSRAASFDGSVRSGGSSGGGSSVEERYANRASLTTYRSIDALDVSSTTPAATPIDDARLRATDNDDDDTVDTDETGVEVSLGGGDDSFGEFDPDRLVMAVGGVADVNNLFHMDTALTSTALTTTPRVVETDAVVSTALVESDRSVDLLESCRSGGGDDDDRRATPTPTPGLRCRRPHDDDDDIVDPSLRRDFWSAELVPSSNDEESSRDKNRRDDDLDDARRRSTTDTAVGTVDGAQHAVAVLHARPSSDGDARRDLRVNGSLLLSSSEESSILVLDRPCSPTTGDDKGRWRGGGGGKRSLNGETDFRFDRIMMNDRYSAEEADNNAMEELF